MLSPILIFAIILIVVRIAVVLSDQGVRERIAAYLSPEYRDSLADATLAEPNVLDISLFVIRARPQMQSAETRRTVLVGALIVISALMPNKSTLMLLFATIFLVFSAMEFRLILEFLGVSTPSREPTNKERIYTILAYAVKISAVFAGLKLCATGIRGIQANTAMGIISMIAGLTVLTYAHIIPMALVQRSRAFGSIEGGFGIDSSRDHVLFLRSFRDDHLKIVTPFAIPGASHPVFAFSQHRFEEFVARSVFPFSMQLVAIGRPNERLPELGALKTYYPDSEWRDAVKITASRSSAIILVAGRTDNLAWEIEHLREWDVLEKAVFILPPEPSSERSQERLLKLLSLLVDNVELPEGWSASNWIAVRVRNGQLEYLVSDARDYASYLVALAAHLGQIDGAVTNLDGTRVSSGQNRTPLNLSMIARIQINRLITQAAKASESGNLEEAINTLIEAEHIAERVGAEGAIALLRLLKGEFQRDAGEEEGAWHTFHDVADIAQRGFRPVHGLVGAWHWRASDIEVEARAALATISTRTSGTIARKTHVEYYESLVRHQKWVDAANVAGLIASNEPTIEGAEQWYSLALTAGKRIGDMASISSIERSYGEYLLERHHPEDAVLHFEEAIRLLQLQEVPETLSEVQILLTRAKSNEFRYDSVSFRFNPASREWFARATILASRRGDANVEPAHLVLAVLSDPESGAILGLEDAMIDSQLRRRAQELDTSPARKAPSSGHDLSFADATKSMLLTALQQCAEPNLISPREIIQILSTSDETYWWNYKQDEVHQAAKQTTTDQPKVQTLALPEIHADPSAQERSIAFSVEADHWDRATSLNFGWPRSAKAPVPAFRPEGLIDEKEMSQSGQILVQYLAEIFHSIRFTKLRPRLLHLLTQRLRKTGYIGPAAIVGLLESEAWILAREFDKSEALLRALLEEDIPGWITLREDPVTGAEIRDEILQNLSELIWVKGDFDERISIEERRVQLSGTLRDPDATILAKTSLAFASAQAGRYEDAAILFEEIIVSSPNQPANVYLMYAATTLELGNPELAQTWVERAETLRPQLSIDVLALKGDIARDLGNKELSQELYKEGLSEAVRCNSHGDQKRFRRRLDTIR